MSRLPLIGITECFKQNGPHASHMSDDTNVRTLGAAASGLTAISASLIKPALASDILDGTDGTPITVTPFNIEPIHNGGLAIRGTPALVILHARHAPCTWVKTR